MRSRIPFDDVSRDKCVRELRSIADRLESGECVLYDDEDMPCIISARVASYAKDGWVANIPTGDMQLVWHFSRVGLEREYDAFLAQHQGVVEVQPWSDSIVRYEVLTEAEFAALNKEPA